MIVKNLTRKSGTGTLLHYLFKYITSKDAPSEAKPFVVRHNIRSGDIAGYIREFEQNEYNRLRKRKDQPAINHVILSWSDKDADKLTDAKLRDMAKEFIRLRGKNNLYVITKHLDRSHIHLHCAVSASQLSGKSSRISKLEFETLKKSLDAYQREKYPELSRSLPAHGKQKEAANMWHRIQNDLKLLESMRGAEGREMDFERVRTLGAREMDF